ncbi:P1 family peptidase [Alicyclobacillus sp. SO9]|uniref:DmpA family aminopeptidase n=1 Tax=Alicyclobacillus sp. SO9 TaxID=2665646 RepID=UPI0018E75AD6|nr:P1 family peptidase [Alicyclobacillus sp. SO9]QQE80126.1 P1 family peptidase [Alicyclobacillus sp. SO9]
MRKRFRDYGYQVGTLDPGPENSITDVAGVSVGHATLRPEAGHQRDVCTGVTAIFPHSGNLYRDKPAAAVHVINGFGKTTGLVQVEELGELESPIMLTNTFSVPAVTEGTLRYMLMQHPEIGDTSGSLNVVVGECNDSYLNDMRGLHVRPYHALEALQRAHKGGAVIEGSVGAGTGMRCFGWKGGIGTASRKVETSEGSFVLGALVLTNFGEAQDLMILGVPVGQYLQPPVDPAGIGVHDASGNASESPANTSESGDAGMGDGSVMVVIGTDAPLDSRQLKRLAKRVAFGLARTGSIAHHGSGDIAIAFSVPRSGSGAAYQNCFTSDAAFMSQYFRAVVESTEEAVLNSLVVNQDIAGRKGRLLTALPMQRVAKLLDSHYPQFR